MLATLAAEGIIELTIDKRIPGNKYLEKAVQKLREKGKHLWADDLLHYAQQALGGDLKCNPESGKFSTPKSDVPIDPWMQGVNASKAFSGTKGNQNSLRRKFPDIGADEEANHAIPWAVGTKHPLIQELNFDQNGLINSKPLKANRVYKDDLDY
ncbi:hypothetical protein [Pseudoalteromonas piscicida]|uniref:Uncharacterized protein n=1 Tax=Pseudoalteromonas piscicida TaxID=43662 RepID=A0A2A5JL92_PSEO7|nr:hypothetical protein [Pseudoalteromonas piscicida]PCK30195.1 hypothetical protein CEX98_18755 [Pseudoalteromonas piscicida]